ncbi:alpha/beta hydrolase [Candidatus Woesearchaeota archaeon]|nr:alpha/beta hydrolase [Candidatus Woesearchaeota archaeon]
MKIKKSVIKTIIFIILSAALLYYGYNYFLKYEESTNYSVSEEGFVNYKVRTPSFTRTVTYQDSSYKKEILIYNSKGSTSKGTRIYADLYLSRHATKDTPVNGIVFMPAAGKTRTDTATRGIFLAKSGYVVLIPDVRGVGDTAGKLNSIQDDYYLFLQDKEPVNHLTIYDTLLAAKILENLPEVRDVIFAGESLGGRTAIIAGAIYDKQDDTLADKVKDTRVKGVLAISTAGYGLQKTPDYDAQRYLNSIDPDFYASKIAPRKAYFIHATKDSTIPIAAGKDTFTKASEPKKFIVINSSCHGYCNEMDHVLAEALKGLFGDK